MCGIAGAFYWRPVDEADLQRVSVIASAVTHRGPDDYGMIRAGSCVLAAQRLAIVDVAGGRQPVSNEAGDVYAVLNGEIYNHREHRALLESRGHVFHTRTDTEILVHMFEEHDTGFVEHLDGQFAIALIDSRTNTLVLARDRFGICPLHVVRRRDAVYFCSEVKGLIAAGVVRPRVRAEAIAQLAYFGTVCAPVTPFAGVAALPPGHWQTASGNGLNEPRRYWSLEFPRAGEHPAVDERVACVELRGLLERAVLTHTQGEFPAACFLSGGVDSAVIAANLARQRDTVEPVDAYCATAADPAFDESSAARATAAELGVRLHEVPVTKRDIAHSFERLIWHGEVPTLSTEAVALMLLAQRARARSKVILTGEGSDEAFGGYLAFRQYALIGSATRPSLWALRRLLRPVLQRRYGSDCLLPSDHRIEAVRAGFGFFPAQAYEFEFYRTAILPVLSPEYVELVQKEGHWDGLQIDSAATAGRHWLDQSLYVGYQIMLPNYLLGIHGDRVFGATSTEGRYPFLDRAVAEFAAMLPPRVKIRHLREKYLLRRTAEAWLPRAIAWRRKRRFMMPFGTPFLDSQAPPLYGFLLEPASLSAYGYFDPAGVDRVVRALRAYPKGAANPRVYLERLALGISLTLVVSTQLWHYLFVESAQAAEPHRGIHLQAAAG